MLHFNNVYIPVSISSIFSFTVTSVVFHPLLVAAGVSYANHTVVNMIGSVSFS